MPSPRALAEQLADSIRDLPSPDPILSRVMELVSDPNTAPRDLSHEISKDAGLAARLMRLSNSVIFGHPREITRIEQAVVLLGFHEIRNMVFFSMTFELLRTEA